MHTELRQHTCAALEAKLKLHHAQLTSAPNFWRLHICAVTKIEEPVTCTFAQGLEAEVLFRGEKKPDRTCSTWAGSFQRKRWFLCCQRCTAFFLWVVLKDQTGRKRPYPPRIQNHFSILRCFDELSVQLSNKIHHRTTVSFLTILNGFNLSAFNFPFEKCRSHPCSTYLQALFTPEKSTRKLPPHNPKRTNAYQLYSITQSYAFIMQ